MPYPKRKYRNGGPIFGWNELMYNHIHKGRWIYYRGKVYHPGFILHMKLTTVDEALEKRWLCEAINQRDEYYKKLQEERLARKEA